jgi:hypothetical protein
MCYQISYHLWSRVLLRIRADGEPSFIRLSGEGAGDAEFLHTNSSFD